MNPFTQAQLTSILDDLQYEFWMAPHPGNPKLPEGDTRVGNKTSFRDLILYRRALFHNHRSTYTKLQGRFEGMSVYTSDLPRKAWTELRARLTENHFRFSATAMNNNPAERVKATKLEYVLNEGLKLVEARNGWTLQEAMSDGQIIDGLAVLHWRKWADMYPDVPPPMLMEARPQTPEEKERFFYTRGEKGYREKPQSVLQRHNAMKAKAGFPWMVEAPDPITCLWAFDKAGLALFGTIEEVPLFTLQTEMADRGVGVMLDGMAKKFSITRANATVPEWDREFMRQRAVVATLWDRHHWYEMAYPSGYNSDVYLNAPWEMLGDAHPHSYGVPPFALVPANQILHRTLHDRYMPVLEGVYTQKPGYDRGMSLLLAHAESEADPVYVLQSVNTGEPMLDDEGNVMQINGDHALAKTVPDGFRLERINAEVSQGFVAATGVLREDYLGAKPPTGRVTYSASTTAWSIRLAQEVENVEPRSWLKRQAEALLVMGRSMAGVMSLPADNPDGFGGPVVVWSRGDHPEIEANTAVGVDPEDIQTMNINVDIAQESGAETIAAIEHGRTLLADKNVPMDPITFLERYMHEDNPEERYAEWRAWQYYLEKLEPQIIQQEAVRAVGTKIVLGQDGQFIAPGGQQVTPEQVLQANGEQPVTQIPPELGGPQPDMGEPPGGAPMMQGPTRATMAPLAPLQAPNTNPLNGRPM